MHDNSGQVLLSNEFWHQINEKKLLPFYRALWFHNWDKRLHKPLHYYNNVLWLEMWDFTFSFLSLPSLSSTLRSSRISVEFCCFTELCIQGGTAFNFLNYVALVKHLLRLWALAQMQIIQWHCCQWQLLNPPPKIYLASSFWKLFSFKGQCPYIGLSQRILGQSTPVQRCFRLQLWTEKAETEPKPEIHRLEGSDLWARTKSNTKLHTFKIYLVGMWFNYKNKKWVW